MILFKPVLALLSAALLSFVACVHGAPTSTDIIPGSSEGDILNLLGLGLVQHINVFITVSGQYPAKLEVEVEHATAQLETLITNLVSVNFDVLNPLPVEITIERAATEAGINGTVYSQFDQSFTSFIIPPFGTANSGTFPNVTLTQGAIASLAIIPLGELDIINADINLRVATIQGALGIPIPLNGLTQTGVNTTSVPFCVNRGLIDRVIFADTLSLSPRTERSERQAVMTEMKYLDSLNQNNSFIVKRVAEGPIFSKEPGNLINIHSQKYSGLANSKTIDVREGPTGIQITHRKKSAAPTAVRSARATTTIRSRTGPRRALGIAARTTKRGYRPDLRSVSLLAKFSIPLPVRHSPFESIRYDTNPLEMPKGVMKDGRGHVCKKNPSLVGADQTPPDTSSSLSSLAALARVSAITASQKEPKPAPPKKERGKKAETLRAALA
ncbi:hypothetical protein EW146_g2390 [Bondarzewia mesenterica]|uniref:Ribosomal eL28/Mak16 domain-containing protein n=1 Tax=Bondarzewia mesenterica TaxID=1095465 RepID=A0A4S4M2A0_9AGAM|nr:hypothetical protein EW146_g2390 [Bondarzewia mesenterica]